MKIFVGGLATFFIIIARKKEDLRSKDVVSLLVILHRFFFGKPARMSESIA